MHPAKEYLNKIKSDKCKLDKLRMQISEINAQEDMLKGIRYDAVKVQTSGGNPLEETAERIIAQRVEIALAVNDILKRQEEALAILKEINNGVYVKLLYKYYFIGRTTFEALSDEFNYTPEHTRVLHSHALDEYQKHLTESYNNK